MKSTVKFSIVMPIALKNRINILARKGLITRNKWIVRTLSRESHYKPSNNDSSGSHEG